MINRNLYTKVSLNAAYDTSTHNSRFNTNDCCVGVLVRPHPGDHAAACLPEDGPRAHYAAVVQRLPVQVCE
jgi:hypothetical protein